MAGISMVLFIATVRFPLSRYTTGQGKQESPFLLAVARLEHWIGVGSASLALASFAALALGIAALAAWRKRGFWLVLAPALALQLAMSALTSSLDFDNARLVKSRLAGPDPQLVDHAGVGSAALVITPRTAQATALEQLFWNRALTKVLVMPTASTVDAFPAAGVRVRDSGLLTSEGERLREPLFISDSGNAVFLTNARRVTSGPRFTLWQPARGGARLSYLVVGLDRNGWLARKAIIGVWPSASSPQPETISISLSQAADLPACRLRLIEETRSSELVVASGQTRTIRFGLSDRRPWFLSIYAESACASPAYTLKLDRLRLSH
jgi:hypothetical protein